MAGRVGQLSGGFPIFTWVYGIRRKKIEILAIRLRDWGNIPSREPDPAISPGPHDRERRYGAGSRSRVAGYGGLRAPRGDQASAPAAPARRRPPAHVLRRGEHWQPP